MYAEILSAIRAQALRHALPFTFINNGSMPVDNGLAMYIGSGTEVQRYFNSGGLHEISIVLNGKHSNLQTVLTALSKIHVKLSSMNYTNTPSLQGDTWQIINISTSSAPNYIGQEDSSKQWLCGSILRVAFYFKGDDFNA